MAKATHGRFSGDPRGQIDQINFVNFQPAKVFVKCHVVFAIYNVLDRSQFESSAGAPASTGIFGGNRLLGDRF